MRRPTHERGVRAWRNQQGRPHRVGGPSLEMNGGGKEWHWNGALVYSEDSSGSPDDTMQWIKFDWKAWSPGRASHGKEDDQKRKFLFPGYDGQRAWRMEQWR